MVSRLVGPKIILAIDPSQITGKPTGLSITSRRVKDSEGTLRLERVVGDIIGD